MPPHRGRAAGGATETFVEVPAVSDVSGGGPSSDNAPGEILFADFADYEIRETPRFTVYADGRCEVEFPPFPRPDGPVVLRNAKKEPPNV